MNASEEQESRAAGLGRSSYRIERLAIVLAAALTGCTSGGLELIPVEGTVTLDGAPLAGAYVVFRPENGRPSHAQTDAEGRYQLRYTMERMGAMPGRHKISISTVSEADPDASDPEQRTGSRERVPAQYNSRSTLDVTLEAGRKEPLDFSLKSTGAARP